VPHASPLRVGSCSQVRSGRLIKTGNNEFKSPTRKPDVWGTLSSLNVRATRPPLEVLDIKDEWAREMCGFDLLLVRPDLHVVWRGDQVPEDAGAIAAVATGQEK
jgi:hypothetical protein